ncbi:hypothetical protein [Leuconostoc pseudomesenteroides]|uniref:hypothetical protein n=1 Tax=Leuconostoc pseudomesenteroides TaxID=33968 RepID=UPI002896ED89|nr:hypothetical protein [Leuconostoc pseudomesenteroides]
MTRKIVNKVVGALVVFLAISPLSTAFADKSISYDNDVKASKSYTMDNGKQINISDQNIEHDDGNSKGDTSPAIEGNKDISLINTDDYLLIPHTNGKWEKIDKNDLLAKVPELGWLLSVMAKIDANDFNHVCSEYRDAADKVTDRGFGLVTTNNQNPMAQTVDPHIHDWFYNDSWESPEKALSVPEGSDSRTPNNWPGGLNYIRQDFYGGWSCDYNVSAKWVGVGKATKY